MAHLRSSRLTLQWRIIYSVKADTVTVTVEQVTPPPTGRESERHMISKAKKTVPARPRVELTPGGSVRVARELQGMTQAELAHASGIPQGTISSIEKGRVTLGAERAEKLARALKVHPAVLLWPNWETLENDEAASA